MGRHVDNLRALDMPSPIKSTGLRAIRKMIENNRRGTAELLAAIAAHEAALVIDLRD